MPEPLTDDALAAITERVAKLDITEADEATMLRFRLRDVEHDLEHVVRERDKAEAEVRRLRAYLGELRAQLAEPIRVFAVIDTVRGRVHGVTDELAEAQQWTRDIVAKHGGDRNAATMTVDAVYRRGASRETLSTI